MRAEPRPALAADPQRERDLRDEDNRGLPARQRLLHTAEIDLGFPAAGDTVNQLHAEFAQLESRANGAESALLRFVQRVRRWRVTNVEGILRGIDGFFPTF